VIAVFLAVDLLVALTAKWTAGRLILPPAAHLGILLVILITTRFSAHPRNTPATPRA
jgi:hypothetical protein